MHVGFITIIGYGIAWQTIKFSIQFGKYHLYDHAVSILKDFITEAVRYDGEDSHEGIAIGW